METHQYPVQFIRIFLMFYILWPIFGVIAMAADRSLSYADLIYVEAIGLSISTILASFVSLTNVATIDTEGIKSRTLTGSHAVIKWNTIQNAKIKRMISIHYASISLSDSAFRWQLILDRKPKRDFLDAIVLLAPEGNPLKACAEKLLRLKPTDES